MGVVGEEQKTEHVLNACEGITDSDEAVSRSLRGQRWFERCGAASQAAAGPGAFDRLMRQCFILSPEEEKEEKTKRKSKQSKCKNCGVCVDCYPLQVDEIVDKQVMNIILKDVPRSFGQRLSVFDSVEKRRELTEVLLLFSVYNQSVSYTQGMNFICAVALGHMSKEHAFWFLVELVATMPESFFRHTALDEVELFGDIVAKFAPGIKDHLETSAKQVDDETFDRAIGYLLVQWMVPVFVHVIPLESTLSLWDFIFDAKPLPALDPVTKEIVYERSSVILNLHRIAFALVEVHSGPLLSSHRRIDEAVVSFRSQIASAPEQSEEEDFLFFSQLADRLENTSGISFVQKLLVAASKDNNPKRIIRLAKELTIEQSWLDAARHRRIQERSRSASPESTWSEADFSTSTSPSPFSSRASSHASLKEDADKPRDHSGDFARASQLKHIQSGPWEKPKAEKSAGELETIFACVGIRERKSSSTQDSSGSDDNCTIS